MAVEFLKKAARAGGGGEVGTRAAVAALLRRVREDGEDAVCALSRELDGYAGEVVVSEAALDEAVAETPPQTRADIERVIAHVAAFARAQRESVREFEVELAPGLFAAQRVVPMQAVGCYVPGGRYAHIASAVMSVTTAKVAGVGEVSACTPPRGGGAPHPAILCALRLAGADRVLAAGGVQGVAALAFGLFGGRAVDVLAGPGNRFVAEAKRMLFGEVGIDMFAGPTEVAIIADKSADARLVAVDLVGQAEHGPDSPAWLIATDREVAVAVLELVPELIAELPETARHAAAAAWRDFGEVALCADREEAARLSDEYAAEHLEVHVADVEWYVERLVNYGSLFVGEETTVAYGDKCSGTNHVLPTKRAARYTGGLSVHKFVKVLTTQRMTREATRETAPLCARISRAEGMEAHARSAEARLRKYFPGEVFDTGVAGGGS